MKKNILILLVISIILFFISFFWFRPGELDLGGDSSRLYFYDPIAYLHSQPLYGITTSGVGGESISYYGIPFILLLAFIKAIVNSPTILVNILQGITLAVSFVSIYFIVKELIAQSADKRSSWIEWAAMLAGLYYIFSPTLILGWDKAILTHYQFFLNPLMFLLILRFLTRNNIKYLFAALIISFLFAANFSFVAAPPFFAFYPLGILFLFIYLRFILKKPLPLKKLMFGLLLFVLVHLFHLGPQIASLFSGGSEINTAVFSSEAKFSRGLSYFSAVAPSVKASFSLMNLAQMTPLSAISFGFILFPVLLLVGFLWNKSKLYLLTAVFFLITLFFVTANITELGLLFYKSLFDLPGFSMFRNFFGQWIFVYTFFYTLLLGQALVIIFEKIKPRFSFAISGLILCILLTNAIPFINGSLVNKIHYQSKNVKVPSKIDPEYEKVLEYIRSVPNDGKFISFPLTGPGYQNLTGSNGGAYQGPSTISYLTGKNDFTGYDGLIPMNEKFLKLVESKDYEGINRIFNLLNIKYVFYNSDTRIYDGTFPKYPYDYVRDYMPKTQKEYKEFLTKLPIKKVKSFGDKYHIYEVNTFLPHIYTADNILYASDALTPYFMLDNDESLRSVVYTSEVAPQNNGKIILEAKNANPLTEIINNYHLHVHEPFISRRPDDILYPIIIWREDRDLVKKLTVPEDYLDFSLLYLSKRLFELEKYKDTPITHKSFTEPKIWEFYKWKNYYSWESNLSRYESDMKKLIAWVPAAPLSEDKKNAIKIKINQNLSQHETYTAKIIKESMYVDSEKQYLSKYTRQMFENLYSTLNIEPNNVSRIAYTLDMPDNSLGEYEVFMKSQDDRGLDPSLYKISLNNDLINPLSTAASSSLIQFENANILSKNTNAIIEYEPTNLVETSPWVGVGDVQENNNETVLSIDNQFENGGFAKKILGYKPNTQYVVTFDYHTEGTDVVFKLYENQKQKEKVLSAKYFNKNLTSKTWKTNQAILTSNADAQSGYIHFSVNSDKLTAKLHIRNISVVQVPNERIIVRKVTAGSDNVNLPSISFVKNNPTHYTVHVSNARDPYTLVFSESFNTKWKVYLSDVTDSQNMQTKTSYFDDQIKEGNHTNIFYNDESIRTAFDTAIAEGRHRTGNGYANVWEILPKDVGNKESYTLQLVFVPQRSIYLFLSISTVTVVGLLLYILLYRKRKK